MRPGWYWCPGWYYYNCDGELDIPPEYDATPPDLPPAVAEVACSIEDAFAEEAAEALYEDS